MNDNRAPELETTNEEVRAIWNSNADFWDERMGEGNEFQRLLVGPAAERLLDLKPGESVLEIACGNGVFARRMANLGARVTATDFAERLLKRALERSAQYEGRIEFRQVDATDRGQLLALGPRQFDAAVCNMAIMDMAAVEPLFSAIAELLKPAGRFVFTVMHPCFNMSSSVLVAEEEDRGCEIITTYSVKVSKYLTARTAKGLAMIGQPVPQYYFNRPLHVLLNACFRAGFLMDGVEEPAFDESVKPNRPLGWLRFKDIPPVFAARMKLQV